MTRLASSPGSRSQPNPKATKYTPPSTIAMDNSNDASGQDTSRRSSRRVERWLDEQQSFPPTRHSRSGSEDSGFWQPPTPKADSSGAPTHPYLACPNLAHCPPLFRERKDDDDVSLNSFVIVEEAETPTNDVSSMLDPYYKISEHIVHRCHDLYFKLTETTLRPQQHQVRPTHSATLHQQHAHLRALGVT